MDDSRNNQMSFLNYGDNIERRNKSTIDENLAQTSLE